MDTLSKTNDLKSIIRNHLENITPKKQNVMGYDNKDTITKCPYCKQLLDPKDDMINIKHVNTCHYDNNNGKKISITSRTTTNKHIIITENNDEDIEEDNFVLVHVNECNFDQIKIDRKHIEPYNHLDWASIYVKKNDKLYLVSMDYLLKRKIIEGHFISLSLDDIAHITIKYDNKKKKEDLSINHINNIVVDDNQSTKNHSLTLNQKPKLNCIRLKERTREKNQQIYKKNIQLEYIPFSLYSLLQSKDELNIQYMDWLIDTEYDDIITSLSVKKQENHIRYMQHLLEFILITNGYMIDINDKDKVMIEHILYNKMINNIKQDQGKKEHHFDYKNDNIYKNHLNHIYNHLTMIDFMINLIICESNELRYNKLISSYNNNIYSIEKFKDSNIKYQDTEEDNLNKMMFYKILNHVIEYETLLFKIDIQNIDLNNFNSLIHQHIKSILSINEDICSIIPKWFAYSISNNDYWIINKEEEEEDGEYIIRFEWIPLISLYNINKGEDYYDNHRIVIKKGLVSLSKNDFYQQFLPFLYGQMIRDSFETLFNYCHNIGLDEFLKFIRNDKFRFFFDSIRITIPSYLEKEEVSIDWFRESIFIPLSQCLSKTYKEYSDESLKKVFECSINHGDINTPLIRTFMKYDNSIIKPVIQHVTKVINKQNKQQQQSCCSSSDISKIVSDIEDLNQYLPPCIKDQIGFVNPFTQKKMHLQYRDRWSAVNYLYDMGYSKEDTVSILSENDPNEIKGCYNEAIDTKRKNSQYRYISLSCKGLINLDRSAGNTMRCIYEKNYSNGKIGKYSEANITEFRRKCASSLKMDGYQTISHPLHYIEHAITKKNL